jgi:hypothetical protein
MSDFYILEGTNNVIDIKKYRTYKEAHKLFTLYKNRITTMHKEEIDVEHVRVKEEKVRYPNHLLTRVKVQIFEKVTGIKL